MAAGAPGETVVSAIVVTQGRTELLDECLRSVEAALEAVEGATELVVVANGIAEAPAAPSALVVETGHNLGFPGGVAAGLRRAGGEWIALVNDDCVLEHDALAELHEAGRTDPRVGAVAAQVRFAGRGVLNSAGLEVDELGIARERLVGERMPADDSPPAEVFGATGAAALYRRAMLDDVGGLDETFFAYLEDADLAWRARMRGWRALYAPRAVVTHHHSATLGHRSPEKYFLVGRNRVRMLAKNATREQLRRRGAAIALYDLGYVVYAAARRRTLAPLRGRIAGLREWRRYREAGTERRAVELARPAGVRAAIRRDRAY